MAPRLLARFHEVLAHLAKQVRCHCWAERSGHGAGRSQVTTCESRKATRRITTFKVGRMRRRGKHLCRRGSTLAKRTHRSPSSGSSAYYKRPTTSSNAVSCWRSELIAATPAAPPLTTCGRRRAQMWFLATERLESFKCERCPQPRVHG